VFICHCGINIGSVVDVPATVEYTKSLPNVVHAEDNLYTCSQDTQDHIHKMIIEHNLNRVVVASCSPRTHEPLFQQTLREAGLNAHLFEMANIRDQCSWIHMNELAKATKKAKDLVAMAVAKVAMVEPLESAALDVNSSALVIGGGLAGLTATAALADQGFKVSLVEREKLLGGNLRKLRTTLSEPNVQAYLKQLIDYVQKHNNTTVYTNTKVDNVKGFVGNFETTLKTGSKNEKIEHGVIIVATGGSEAKPEEYLYSSDDRIMTQLELENFLAKNENLADAKSVVMIQCVGSREQGHMYCSRICCSTAMKNALKIKETSPETEVYILYRDIRTYGFNEEFFQQARDRGVIFIPYELDNKPEVTNNGKLKVAVREPLLDKQLILQPDLLILSSRIEPDKGNTELGQMLKIPMNEDGFFLEAHVKLRPVDFSAEGIFLAGLAHAPKNIAETIAQAKAAAARACTIISKNQYVSEPIVAHVDEDVCSGCGICTQVCPHEAPELVVKNGRRVCEVNRALCKGCGSCASLCPSGAMQQLGFKAEQISAMVQAALS